MGALLLNARKSVIYPYNILLQRNTERYMIELEYFNGGTENILLKRVPPNLEDK